MRSIILILACVTSALPVAVRAEPTGEATPATRATAPAPEFDDAAALAMWQRAIAGREREPAETVFSNIQIHRGKPAAAVLSIMDIAYRKSLGVHCTHCHDPGNWGSDEKVAKRVTREMSRMTRELNEKLLAPIEGLRSPRPMVNCTTCHRGEVVPALDIQT